ncbi:hypothetical protein IQ243_25965 [Nostocales cyanobacterium LEGE 11386]|nr:hypothetical protein [Nostocales cyanobacterium LEGE 11386]
MSITQKLTEFAEQQNFDVRSSENYEGVWQDAGITNIPETTIKEGDRLLSLLKDSEASPEFIMSFLAYSYQKGMPLYVMEHIMNSDLDGDGRPLWREFFYDGTDPLATDPCRKQAQKSRQIELEL